MSVSWPALWSALVYSRSSHLVYGLPCLLTAARGKARASGPFTSPASSAKTAHGGCACHLHPFSTSLAQHISRVVPFAYSLFRFDSVTPAEIPTRMNEEISKIQSAIGHQLGTGTMNASMFVLGVILGLVRGWQVALIVCSAMPLIGMSSGALGFFMSQKEKVQMDAYAASGAVAEEVTSPARIIVPSPFANCP